MHIVAARMKNSASLPLVDVETYVPAAITVVRRSRGWPGLFLQERRGKSGRVDYVPGVRQHVFYYFLKPLRSDVIVDGEVRKVVYRAGEGRVTTAGRPVSFRWTGEVQILMLGFEPWFFERIAAELGGTSALHGAANMGKLAASHPACVLMRALVGELDAPPGAPTVAEGIARAIAVLLLREYQQLPARKPADVAPPVAVLRAVELMRRRMVEPLTLEELAHAAGLSPFHFARQFKTATGHPPHDYLVRLRVDRAQELMRRERGWTMAAVAQDAGFADQSHMARHFKRVLGVTPRQFADAKVADA
jgi:AraC family transcriptional regulator